MMRPPPGFLRLLGLHGPFLSTMARLQCSPPRQVGKTALRPEGGGRPAYENRYGDPDAGKSHGPLIAWVHSLCADKTALAPMPLHSLPLWEGRWPSAGGGRGLGLWDGCHGKGTPWRLCGFSHCYAWAVHPDGKDTGQAPTNYTQIGLGRDDRDAEFGIARGDGGVPQP